MSDCCATPNQQPHGGDRHLLIIGGGSAAFTAALKASELGARVTLVNAGLPVGGTCVNVGCVPSKTLLRAAEAHHRARRQPFAGIRGASEVTDFAAVMRQRGQLVEELRQAKYLDVVAGLPGFSLVQGRARLVGPCAAEVDGRRIEADRLIIATGAAPAIPPVEGLAEVPYLTNETAFELTELPRSLLIIGGNYIGLETAQIFARLGSRVTVVQRRRILPSEAPNISDELLAHLGDEGIEVLEQTQVRRVHAEGGVLVAAAAGQGGDRILRATHLLLAAGRRPRTRDMGLEAAGVDMDARGFIKVDEHLQTSAAGVYAAGDVIGPPMFVYTAAYEGALAAANALGDAPASRDYGPLPWVVFSDPQVAGVGMDERQAREHGIDAEASVLPLSHVPRAIAARDTRGLIKIIRQRETHRILGARVVAPEGSELLMEVALAMRGGLTSEDLASTLHPYLTLSEGIKLAAISFDKAVDRLSCCAA